MIRFKTLWMAPILALSCAACGSGASVPTPDYVTAKLAKDAVVASWGETVGLYVPPGALAADTELQLALLDPIPLNVLPGKVKVSYASDVVSFVPAVEPSRPVGVVVKLKQLPALNDTLVGVRWNGKLWDVRPIHVSGEYATVRAAGVGRYAIVLVAGSAPALDVLLGERAWYGLGLHSVILAANGIDPDNDVAAYVPKGQFGTHPELPAPNMKADATPIGKAALAGAEFVADTPPKLVFDPPVYVSKTLKQPYQLDDPDSGATAKNDLAVVIQFIDDPKGAAKGETMDFLGISFLLTPSVSGGLDNKAVTSATSTIVQGVEAGKRQMVWYQQKDAPTFAGRVLLRLIHMRPGATPGPAFVSSPILLGDIVCADKDGDGYDDLMCGGDDCDDGNPDVHPGKDEVCGDGIDQDCSFGPDDGCTPGGECKSGVKVYEVSVAAYDLQTKKETLPPAWKVSIKDGSDTIASPLVLGQVPEGGKSECGGVTCTSWMPVGGTTYLVHVRNFNGAQDGALVFTLGPPQTKVVSSSVSKGTLCPPDLAEAPGTPSGLQVTW